MKNNYTGVLYLKYKDNTLPVLLLFDYVIMIKEAIDLNKHKDIVYFSNLEMDFNAKFMNCVLSTDEECTIELSEDEYNFIGPIIENHIFK